MFSLRACVSVDELQHEWSQVYDVSRQRPGIKAATVQSFSVLFGRTHTQC